MCHSLACISELNTYVITSTQPTQPCDKPPSLPSDASHQHRDAPRFHQNLNSVELADYLRRGVPVVVTGIQIQGTYDPQYFRDRYRTRPVLLQNCETGQQKRSTVEKFFETFGKPWLRTKRGIWKLKVRPVLHTWLLIIYLTVRDHDRTGPLKKIFARNFLSFSMLS